MHKLYKFVVRKVMSKDIFTSRVLDECNNLNDFVIDANAIKSSKCRSDILKDRDQIW